MVEDTSKMILVWLPCDLILWIDKYAAPQAHRTRNGYIWHLLAEEKARQETEEVEKVAHEPA